MNTTRMKNQVYLLEEGSYYNDIGVIVCVAKTKKAMMEWIKAERPDFKRNIRDYQDEVFYECDAKSRWLNHHPALHVCEFVG